MSLLQISEPGESPAPHQRRLAVGIDLGTTHSLVATVRSSSAECLADARGRVLLPSIVHYAPGGAVEVGYEASERAADDPANTIVSVKRFMGRGVADVAKYGALPYRFIDVPGMVAIETAVVAAVRELDKQKEVLWDATTETVLVSEKWADTPKSTSTVKAALNEVRACSSAKWRKAFFELYPDMKAVSGVSTQQGLLVADPSLTEIVGHDRRAAVVRRGPEGNRRMGRPLRQMEKAAPGARHCDGITEGPRMAAR